ncbi:MAG: PorT family protein [Vicingus serpentipes]|nr:PorT family protein [Vicingus serpentipes]
MNIFKLILIPLVVLSINPFFAQKISIGPEVGINLIPIEKSALGNNYQLGYYFGSQVKYYFSENFALSSGLFATQKKKSYSHIDTTTTADPFAGAISEFMNPEGSPPGGGTEEADVYNTTNGVASELYLQLPILANYEYKKINFYAGPYTSILLNANRKEVYESESTAIDISTFIPSEYSALEGLLNGLTNNDPESASYSSIDGLATIDVGVIGGIGYRIDKLNFNLMYSYGFLDYRKDKKNNSTDPHQLVQFSIAYLFNIKIKQKKDSEKEINSSESNLGHKKHKNKYDLGIK